jgi:hypothetical protein
MQPSQEGVHPVGVLKRKESDPILQAYLMIKLGLVQFLK